MKRKHILIGSLIAVILVGVIVYQYVVSDRLTTPEADAIDARITFLKKDQAGVTNAGSPIHANEIAFLLSKLTKAGYSYSDTVLRYPSYATAVNTKYNIQN